MGFLGKAASIINTAPGILNAPLRLRVIRDSSGTARAPPLKMRVRNHEGAVGFVRITTV